MRCSMKDKTRKEEKRKEAEERKQRYNSLTTQQKIDQAMSRRGESKKELNKLINQSERNEGKND